MALTRTQALALMGDLVAILNDIDNYGHVNTPNFTSRYATAFAANAGTYPTAIQAALDGARAGLSAQVTAGAVQALIAPVFDEYLYAISDQAAGDASVSLAEKFRRIRDDMVTNGYTLVSRAIVRGSATAGGSNTGSGTINRLYLGPSGYPLEGSWVEVETAVCVKDQQSVEKHAEVFEFRGASRTPGLLNLAGSGRAVQAACFTTRNSESFGIVNPTFSSFVGTAPTASTPTALAAVTDVSGWTVNSITDAKVTLDYAYRDFPTESNAYALEFGASNYVYQTLNASRILDLDEFTPIYMQVAFYRRSSADGTITLTLGATTFSVDGTTLNNGAWNLVKLTLGSGLWLKSFTSNNLQVKIAVASQTTGYWEIDDVIVAPMVLIGGSWRAPVGGATPFKLGDTFTFTDTDTSTIGIMSRWINFRAQIRTDISLPCAPAAPSAPSAALAGAGAGNVDNGTHVYAVTVVSADGVEGPVGTSSSSVNVTDKTTNGKVSLTSIPTGPTGTASRKVYRSAAGTSTPLKLLTTISGNVTTTYTDNTADASLGATVNSQTAIADPA